MSTESGSTSELYLGNTLSSLLLGKAPHSMRPSKGNGKGATTQKEENSREEGESRDFYVWATSLYSPDRSLWITDIQRVAAAWIFYSYRDYPIYGQQLLGRVLWGMKSKQALNS